jgi:FkbM family methyltransferase
MESLTLPNGWRIFHLNEIETTFLYQEIVVAERYLRHGIHLDEGATVFDVGANIGLFSLWVRSRCPTARLYAFEPMPRTFAVLEANLPGARVYPIALGAEEGRAQFSFYPNNSILSGRHADPEADRARAVQFALNRKPGLARYIDTVVPRERFERELVECRCRRLSSILREEQIEEISLLKVDVERAEDEVLAGIDESDWPRIGQLVAEVHDEDGRVARWRSELERRGFRVAVEEDPAARGTGLFEIYAMRGTTTASALP